MNFNYCKISVLLFIVFLAVSIIPAAVADQTYTAQPEPISHQYNLNTIKSPLENLLNHQKIYVNIPSSLLNYYGNLTHALDSDNDYAQLVTPDAVTPIAQVIRNETDNLPNSNEQFADAVLALVHQIPYNITGAKYPIETLADNVGDCAGLSILAASIMQAGGLDVVLIHYININPSHMNVGVYLPNTPVYHTILMPPTSFTYDNKTYWTAECTPGNWKVGDQSLSMTGVNAVIIPLNNTIQTLPPAQLSASLEEQQPSNITININQQPTNNQTETNTSTRALTISGSITPPSPNQSITIYTNTNNNQTPTYFATTTDNDGNYNAVWNFTDSAAYYVTASWNGAEDYAGSDSETIPVFVGPQAVQLFSTYEYNYIYAQIGTGPYATAPMQGTNEFLTIPLGTNVSLSYNFIVLQAGQTTTNAQPTNQESTWANRITPASWPIGLEPLRLPDDFNQTLNDQFCFILQNNSPDNYTLNIKGLSQIDLSNIQDNATITNATDTIKENTWYQTTANITQNTATTALSDNNGTLLQTTSNPTNNKTVLLIGNNQNTAIVLKNLTIQTQNPQQPPTTPKPTNNTQNLQTLLLYAVIATLLATITTTMALYRKKKRQTRQR